MDVMPSVRSKAAIYVRVSTADQHIESQLYDLRVLAEKRGFEVVREYQDEHFLKGRNGSGALAKRDVSPALWRDSNCSEHLLSRRRSSGSSAVGGSARNVPGGVYHLCLLA
jgi:resolvase-like protein